MDKIKEFIGKQSIGFYVGLMSIPLILVGTIMLAVNGTMPYYNDYNAIVPLMGSLAIIVTIALLSAKQFVKVPHLECLWIVVIVLAGIGLMVITSMRVESLAYVLGSDLENDNAAAQAGVKVYLAGAIIDLIGILVAVVASFFKITKED